MTRRRVVVTGLGCVSPLGNSVNDSWRNLIAGKSGIDTISHFDASGIAAQIAGEVKNFDPTLYFSPKEARKLDTFLHYGMAASVEAFEDSGLVIPQDKQHCCGVALGAGMGGLPLIEKNYDDYKRAGARRISPFFIPGTIINMFAGLVSMRYHLKGPNISIVTACTTGTHNIGHAMRMIQYGDAEVMLAGGAEMATSPLGVGGFASMKALSKRNDEPQKASRPFDKDRDGFVLGEGAGVLVLEELEHAKRRGAKIYCELTGFGMSADAYHMSSPDPTGDGFARAMLNAMQDAQCNPDQIQHVNAHATSTPAGDPVEVEAIKLAYGEHAKKLAISGTKSQTGHLLGAAGAVEAIFTILSLHHNTVPGTMNLENPGEGCDLDFVPNQAREVKLTNVLSNSFGFGGTNGALVFARCP